MQATTFVEDTIRRSNRNLLLISVIALVILIGAEVLAYRYFYNFFTGPHEITKDELLALEDAEKLEKYYVTVKADDVFDTGYQYVTEENGVQKSVDNSYPALWFDQRVLLVKTAGALPEKLTESYIGALMPISEDENREIITDMISEDSRWKQIFLPYKLDATNFKTPGYIGLAAAAVVLLGSVWGIGTAMSRGSDMSRHPIMKSLSRFGDAQSVAQQINMESSTAQKVSNIHLTRNWLYTGGGSSLDAVKLNDIVWIYKKVTQQRSGKTFSALIWDKHGHCITVNANEQGVNEMLDAIYKQAPWIFAGFDQQIDQAWRSNRQSVIDAVNQRRQQVRGA